MGALQSTIHVGVACRQEYEPQQFSVDALLKNHMGSFVKVMIPKLRPAEVSLV